MKSAAYRIVHSRDGWGVEHDGKVEGSYDTKEAAFEAAVGPASNEIKLRYAVSIMAASRRSARAERNGSDEEKQETGRKGMVPFRSGRTANTGGPPWPRRRRCATSFTTR